MPRYNGLLAAKISKRSKSSALVVMSFSILIGELLGGSLGIILLSGSYNISDGLYWMVLFFIMVLMLFNLDRILRYE